MAGRHRRPPAWRRLLLRLRRSDRAARTAALQAEVVALRATVLELRAQLDTARVSAVAPPARERRFVTLNLPMVQAALASPELASTAAAAAASAPLARAATIELDLTADSAQTEIVLADLPEAALLDPRRDRTGEPVEDPALLRAAHKVAAGKHARLESPLRRTA